MSLKHQRRLLTGHQIGKVGLRRLVLKHQSRVQRLNLRKLGSNFRNRNQRKWRLLVSWLQTKRPYARPVLCFEGTNKAKQGASGCAAVLRMLDQNVENDLCIPQAIRRRPSKYRLISKAGVSPSAFKAAGKLQVVGTVCSRSSLRSLQTLHLPFTSPFCRDEPLQNSFKSTSRLVLASPLPQAAHEATRQPPSNIPDSVQSSISRTPFDSPLCPLAATARALL